MSVTPARRLAIAQRRQQVAKLYLQGMSQAEIATDLHITRAQVSKDIEKIQQAWRESAIRDFDAQRDLELARIDRIESEAWAAWHRSKEPSQSAVVAGEAGSQKARRTVKNQNGNPRFLELALRCGEERRKILGLDAPVKIAPTTPDGRPLTAEQRLIHMRAILTEQFGSHAIVELTEEVTTYGPETSAVDAGEHDGRRPPAVEPAGDDEEPLSASTAGRLPGADV